MRQLLETLQGGEQLALRRRIFRNIEEWLHKGQGNCCLTRPEVAALILGAVHNRVQSGVWNVLEFVVMPNHLHLFIELGNGAAGAVMPAAEDELKGTVPQPTRSRSLAPQGTSGDEDTATRGASGVLGASPGARGLEPVMRSFKHWTAVAANRVMGVRGERFWQREWFDHWSRSWREDEGIIRYIRNNPVKAGLVRDFRDWPYGSWSQ